MRGHARIAQVLGFDASLSPDPFEPTDAERRAIDANWRSAVEAKPRLFDGPVLLADGWSIERGRAVFEMVRTSFAVYLWRRSLGFPEDGLGNAFGAAVVVSSDGAALLGRMASGTANEGAVYFPAGTPDLADVVGGRVDIEGSILRELGEETGLAGAMLRPTERRLVVAAGGQLACLRRFDVALDAASLEAAARRHLADQAAPEFDAVSTVRAAAELDRSSPAYVHAALGAMLAK